MKLKNLNTKNAVAAAWANPDRVVEIVKAVPEVIRTIAKGFPDKIMEFVEVLPDNQAFGLADISPKHAPEIAAKFPNLAVSIARNAHERHQHSHPNLVLDIVRAVPNIAVELARILPEMAPNIAGVAGEHAEEIKKLFALED